MKRYELVEPRTKCLKPSNDGVLVFYSEVQSRIEQLEGALHKIRETLGDFGVRWNERETTVDKIAQKALQDSK